MLRGIYSSASGMIAGAHAQRVVGNNLSNVNTPGYRAGATYLSPFARAFLARTGTSISGPAPMAGNATPLGDVSLGTRVAEVSDSDEPGRLQSTGRATDMAIDGEGYFAVTTTEGVALTRAGNFRIDEDGQLVDRAGHTVMGVGGDPVFVGSEAFSVDARGRVSVEGEITAQLALVRLPADSTLERGYDGLVRPRDLDAAALLEAPWEGSEVVQGVLELSNVDLVREMTKMMTTFRAYGSNHSALKIQDEALGDLIRVIENL